MAKEKIVKQSPKKEMKVLVKKNLETLLVNLEPGVNKKKISKKVKKAGKILIKGIKGKKLGKFEQKSLPPQVG